MQYPQVCNESAYQPAFVLPVNSVVREEVPSYEMLIWGEEEEDVPREEKKLTTVSFRKAEIAVSNPRRFQDGLICGLAAAVDSWWAQNEDDFFDYLEELVVDDVDFGISWKIGFLLGMTDGLLRARKTAPPAMALKAMTRKARERFESAQQAKAQEHTGLIDML